MYGIGYPYLCLMDTFSQSVQLDTSILLRVVNVWSDGGAVDAAIMGGVSKWTALVNVFIFQTNEVTSYNCISRREEQNIIFTGNPPPYFIGYFLPEKLG